LRPSSDVPARWRIGGGRRPALPGAWPPDPPLLPAAYQLVGAALGVRPRRLRHRPGDGPATRHASTSASVLLPRPAVAGRRVVLGNRSAWLHQRPSRLLAWHRPHRAWPALDRAL